MPDMEMMKMVIQMVDQGPEGGDHAMPLENPALLTAVFAGGNPHYLNPMLENPADFTQYRWDPEKMDQTFTPAAQAQTIIKEVEWSNGPSSSISPLILVNLPILLAPTSVSRACHSHISITSLRSGTRVKTLGTVIGGLI